MSMMRVKCVPTGQKMILAAISGKCMIAVRIAHILGICGGGKIIRKINNMDVAV